MPVPQRLSTTTDDRDVVVKQAGPGPAARRLQHEASVLRQACHPGVVEVVADRPLDDGGHELMVALVGSSTIADLVGDGRTGLDGIAGLVVAVATTVADLHELGVAHTRLAAEHVLLDAAGRPLLCGFGDAVVATGGSPLPVSVRAVDVAALGSLLRQLVTADHSGDGGWEPIPTRRLAGLAGVAGRGERWQAYARRTLLNVADRATVDDAAHRPDARTFAADVLAALPEARLPGVVGTTDEAPLPSRVPRSSRPRWSGIRSRLTAVAAIAARIPWTPIAGAVGLGLLLFGLNGVLTRPGQLDTAARGPEPLSVHTTTPDEPVESDVATSTTTPPPASTTAPACSPPPPAGPVADPDGDGCSSSVTIAGGVVEVGGTRYAVGAPGDLLAVGDWDCDGDATVALVERVSGRVFLFDRWAGPDDDVSVGPAAVVADPDGIEVAGTDACDVLVVSGADGTRTEVPG